MHQRVQSLMFMMMMMMMIYIDKNQSTVTVVITSSVTFSREVVQMVEDSSVVRYDTLSLGE